MRSRIRGLQPPTTRQLVTAANVAVVACCCLFVWLHLQPHLLLRNTTPSGGDMGAHVWGPAYLRDTLLPQGRLTGWTMDWYAGFPALTFYFPLPSLMIALLSFVLPYGIAFKLITVLGLVSLPAAAAAFGVLSGMRRPYAACLAVATVPFLFDRGWTIYGGNVGSTLAGEFSFSISLSFALLFLGVLARSLDTGKHRGWAIVLLGATALCHILPTIFAIVAAVVMVAIFPRVKRFGVAATIGVLGMAVTGFWLVPFAVRLPLTNDMGWEKIERYGLPLVGRSLGGPEEALLWLSVPAAVAIAVYAAVALDRRRYQAVAAGLVVGGILAAVGASGVIVRLFDQTGTDADLTAIGQSGLDPVALRWLVYAALAGSVISLVRGRRVGTILTYTALMAAIAFRFMPGPTSSDPNATGKLWNARMLPFWYLCLYLLAACLVAELALGLIALWRRFLRAPHQEELAAADQRAEQARLLASLGSALGLAGAARIDAVAHDLEARRTDLYRRAARAVDPGTAAAARDQAEQARMLAHLAAALGMAGAPRLHLAADSLEHRAATIRERAAGFRAVPQILVPTIAAFVVLGYVAAPFEQSWLPIKAPPTYLDDWARWNYVGYEGRGDGPQRVGEKARKVEYFDVVNTMKRIGDERGCGRAMWEYEPELDAMGTPMALMLLPYWTDSCIGSSEGLYFESSPSTAAHFMKAGSVSKKPSNPQRGLPYTPLDLAGVGIPRMQLMGDRYYMAISPDAQAQADADERLTLVAETARHEVRYSDGIEQRSWKVYEVQGAELVQPLRINPVVVAGLPESETVWKAMAMKGWFADPARADVLLATEGPRAWARVAPAPPMPDDPTPDERFRALGADVELPRQVNDRAVTVSGIEQGHSSLEFDVDQVGVPVLVKVSYFPNWKLKGADGPYRVTPNFMVVVPTRNHVELTYGYTWAEGLGWALTILGLGSALVLNRRRVDTGPLGWRPRRRRATGAGDEPVEAGVADAPAPDGGEEREVDPERPDREGELVPAGSAPLAPEGDAQVDEAADRAGDAAGDGGPGGAELLDRDRQLGGGEPGALGPQHQLGVEQVGAEAAGLDHPEQGLAPQHLHAVGVADPEPEAVAEDEGEHGGDQAAGESPLVVGAGAPLGADNDDRASGGGDREHGGVKEVEVDVVDVEVDDHLAPSGQEPRP